MTKMIAYCGLVCSDCPTFLATRNDDDTAREKTAAMLEEKYGLHFKPEEINCDGCRSEGARLIGFCRTCVIRQCGLGRGVENCTSCADQPCEELLKFHAYSPEAKACFDALKERPQQ